MAKKKEHKETKEHLRYMQSLPLDMKVRLTQQRIHEWVREFGEDGVYVSFSGGKDSTVLLDIVRGLYPDVPAVFVDTGLEYPEIRKFALSVENLIKLTPEMPFNRVIKEKGYPIISKTVSHNVSIARRNPDGKVMKNCFNPKKKGPYAMYRYSYLLEAPFLVSDLCCDIMKKNPVHSFSKETGRKAIVATMACESRLRLDKWLESGCNAFDDEYPTSKPMSFWTEQDVLRYIHTHNLRYCKEIYGDIVYDCDDPEQVRFDEAATIPLKTTEARRTGCMFCMFGVQLEKHPNRFERMKITHPQLWDYCINKLGCGAVMDYIGVTYGKEEQKP